MNATLSGPSAAEYYSKALPSLCLQVVKSSVQPTLPKLSSAIFSAAGDSILVSFNVATDRAGYSTAFPCSSIVHFRVSMLASCAWTSDSSFQITPGSGLGSGGYVMQGDAITLVGGTIRSQCPTGFNSTVCAAWQAAPSSAVNVTYSSSPAIPVMTISSSSVVSACNDINLAMQVVSGSGGRPMSSYALTVSSSLSSPSTRLIQAYLNSNCSGSLRPTIPSRLLVSGLSYQFSFSLCNFMGGCGSVATAVAVSSAAVVPQIAIPGPSFRSMFRSSSLEIKPNVFTVDCLGAVRYDGLSVAWVVTQAGVVNSSLVSTSKNNRVFALPAFALQPSTLYEVTATVTLVTNSHAASSASVFLNVGRGSLQALIAGSNVLSVKSGGSVLVDGSGSYDSDDSVQATNGLSFAWSCSQQSPTVSAHCPLLFSSNSAVQVLVTAAASIAVNATLLVQLIISRDARTASTSVMAIVVPSTAATVAFASSSADFAHFDPTSKLSLLAKVQTQSLGCDARWSASSVYGLSSLQSLVSTALVTPLPAQYSGSLYLAIPANTLPSPLSFTITLSCGTATSSISISTNAAPSLGSFQVLPSVGVEYKTQFEFDAMLWIDADLPLSYVFGLSSNSQFLVLRSESESSLFASTLASPSAHLNPSYNVTCVVQVYDSLNTFTQATTSVSVKPSLQSLNVSLLLSNAAGSSDAQLAVVALILTSINRVDCSSAPQCSHLSREQCSGTVNTCGPCLVG
ncbi:REJ domain-containing protein, partial [Phenylobacterium aquaticum]|uniref:REJ domain-containing protein n=1 Tax=Phenylobacterium aquaticum TaxID=1763816 RepID=UPI0026EF4285